MSDVIRVVALRPFRSSKNQNVENWEFQIRDAAAIRVPRSGCCQQSQYTAHTMLRG